MTETYADVCWRTQSLRRDWEHPHSLSATKNSPSLSLTHSLSFYLHIIMSVCAYGIHKKEKHFWKAPDARSTTFFCCNCLVIYLELLEVNIVHYCEYTWIYQCMREIEWANTHTHTHTHVYIKHTNILNTRTRTCTEALVYAKWASELTSGTPQVRRMRHVGVSAWR